MLSCTIFHRELLRMYRPQALKERCVVGRQKVTACCWFQQRLEPIAELAAQKLGVDAFRHKDAGGEQTGATPAG